MMQDIYPDWGASDEECPKCGEVKSTRRGMEQHFTKTHGYSISFAVVKCDNCGDALRRTRATSKDREIHVCDKKCESEFKSEREAPPDHNFRKDGTVEYECHYCGETNEKYPSSLAQAEKNFCDKECHIKHQVEKEVDETHNFYKGGPAIVHCAECGSELERKPCLLDRSENFFCDGECEGAWKSRNLRGSNHPRWSEDTLQFSYGGSWEKKREERLEKDDYECVVCNKSNAQEEIDHGRGLSVHHIQKARKFLQDDGTLDEETAHRIENLITLCSKCHSRWEGIPLRPEVSL